MRCLMGFWWRLLRGLELEEVVDGCIPKYWWSEWKLRMNGPLDSRSG
jgi:hypothetical protein